MELDRIVSWFVAVAASLVLLRLLLAGAQQHRGWIAIHGMVLALLAAGLLADPVPAGWVAAGVWAVAVLLPILVAGALQRALLRQRFGLAAFLARTAALLHPLDGWRRLPVTVGLFEELHHGNPAAALARLEDEAGDDGHLARLAHLLGAQLADDWHGYCLWIDDHPDRERLLRDPAVLAGYLAALGRTGDRAGLLEAYRRHAEPLARRLGGAPFALVRLAALTQLGRVERVRELLSGVLRGLPEPARCYYVAEAEQVAGRPAAAAELLERALADPRTGTSLRVQCERRLASPLPPLAATELGEDGRDVLADLERDLHQERQFGAIGPGGGVPRVTLALAVVLLAVYAVEVLRGGSENDRVLVELGALVVPPAAPYDQSWRVLTAGLLHFGPVHLTLNLAALLLFGYWLERAWPPLRVLLCYLLAIVVSNGLLCWLERVEPGHGPMLFVGASGGIMGLLGGLLGRLLVGRLAGRSPELRRQLVLLVLLVVLQVAFDLSVPQVSGTAHGLGLVAGLVFGVVVTSRDALRARA